MQLGEHPALVEEVRNCYRLWEAGSLSTKSLSGIMKRKMPIKETDFENMYFRKMSARNVPVFAEWNKWDIVTTFCNTKFRHFINGIPKRNAH